MLCIALVGNCLIMKTIAKIKFWSLLTFGLLFLFVGAFMFTTASGSRETSEVLMFSGIGQLTLFYFLLFWFYKKK